MKSRSHFDQVSQFTIPTLTATGFLLTSFKYPEWGILVNLSAQPFYCYSSYKAYKNAGQIGLLVTTILLTIILIYGAINYWVL